MVRLRFVSVLVFLCIETIHFSWCIEYPSLQCKEKERNVLFEFKQSLTDPSHRLSSWVGKECCSWHGVACDNRTGHVVKIDLRNPHPFDRNGYDESTGYDSTYSKACLVGKELNPSLLELKHLNYLDLSWNNFSRSRIPNFLGSFRELRYLNLSCAWFNGNVPPNLGNISTLHFLDLNSPHEDIFYSHVELRVDSLRWVSHLYSLQYLNLNGVNLGQASGWEYIMNGTSSLSELHLSECELQNFSSIFSRFNLTALTVLDLSYNHFDGQIPNALRTMTSLQFLDLSNNQLVSPIPSWLGSFHSLIHLDLQYNKFTSRIPNIFANSFSQPVGGSRFGRLRNIKFLSLAVNSFSGSIPKCIWTLSTLRVFDLSYNQLNGTISKDIGQLSELRSIDLYANYFAGFISKDHFAKLSKLRRFYLSDIHLKVGSHWVPPFQLKYFYLNFCKLGPKFPTWLKTQRELQGLDISYTSISDSIPSWFGNQSSSLIYVDLSHNQIHGQVPHFLQSKSSEKLYLWLSSNKFQGPLPHFPSNLVMLDLHNNSISGPLPTNLGDMMPPALKGLYLSANHINGSIPTSICKMKALIVLDISKNYITGDLPQCWIDLQKLEALKLASNNLSGNIATSTGRLYSLKSLNLFNNSFHGEIPFALKNSSSLYILDLGENRLSESIPTWIGDLPSLKVLNLRSNVLIGSIPPQLCNLISLQILVLAENNISGTVPPCFGNIRGMVHAEALGGISGYDFIEYEDELIQMMKGIELDYDSEILSMLANLDISSNNLVGWIPEELTFLSGLIGLNLSNNHLKGSIPKNVGNLTSLESLDLSMNNLSGTIPQSLSGITTLSVLNVSYNNLVGRIPSGNQLQTLNDPSIYRGNTDLCGDPLENICEGDEPSQAKGNDDVHEKTERDLSKLFGFYVGIVSAVWGMCCVLFKNSWRYAYFQFIDNIADICYEKIVGTVAWLKKKIKFNSAIE